MISSKNNEHQLSQQDVLDIKRMRIPNSTRLQKNIRNLTDELPQYTDKPVGARVYNLAGLLDKVGFKNVNVRNSYKPYAATIAAGIAVIVVSFSLWSPTQNDQIAVANLDSLSDQQLAEEIEWQDLMLLQDELGFAGL
ncbi:hypothetical protein N9060_00760 [Arenicella sp.]|nr:hypothetical protein [Arenicella sp.]